jgi:hypothetical protein
MEARVSSWRVQGFSYRQAAVSLLDSWDQISEPLSAGI